MKYTPTQYASALYDMATSVTPAKRKDTIRDFLDAITKNGALGLLPDVIREFKHLSDTADGVHIVTISTPERMTQDAVSAKLPFKGKVRALRDVRLIGGAVIEVDDLRITNSIRSRLDQAREAFTK